MKWISQGYNLMNNLGLWAVGSENQLKKEIVIHDFRSNHLRVTKNDEQLKAMDKMNSLGLWMQEGEQLRAVDEMNNIRLWCNEMNNLGLGMK